jgi:hypothetical protein
MSLRAWFSLLAAAICCASCDDVATQADPRVIAIRFATMPATVEVDSPFSVTVELLGPDGERAATQSEAVALSLIGVGSLAGTTTATASQGLATFTNLSVTAASEALQLQAVSAGITASSPTFRATDDCAPMTVAFPPSLSGSLSGYGCSIGGGPAVFYRFTNPVFGPVQLTVTSSGEFVPEVALINDPPSDFIPVSGAGPAAIVTSILPAAMYRLRISAPPGTGGDFTVTTNTAPVAGCVLRTLLPFALVTYPGTITADDCNENGGNYDVYRLYSPKPCTLLIQGKDAVFDARLVIRNARSGAVVAQDDDSAGGIAGKDAGVMLVECRDGTDPIDIYATVSGATPGAIGDYSIVVQITGGVSLFSIGPGAARR